MKKTNQPKIITSYRKVGVKYPPENNADVAPKLWKLFTYKDIDCEPDGWVDVNKYLPKECDLVDVKCSIQKTFSAWVLGNKWNFLNVNPDEKVLFWKRKKEQVKNK